jgi:hypothetical protein
VTNSCFATVIGDDLRRRIADLNGRIANNEAPLQRLERKIRGLERDANAVVRFSRERRLMNRK